jgi:hypothetical protein
LTLTLWQYVTPTAGVIAAAETAAAVKVVHEALADFDGALPPFTVELDDARVLLQSGRSSALEPADRGFLSGVVSEIEAAVATLDQTGGRCTEAPTTQTGCRARTGHCCSTSKRPAADPSSGTSLPWSMTRLAFFPMPTAS